MGSSSYITNLDGNVTQHMEYLPFGEMLVDEHQNSNNSPFKFNGKELDEETGNYYYGARYYSPKYNLMLSVDPASEMYPGISPYAYTLNNPVRYTDPTGMVVESPPSTHTDEDGNVVAVYDDGDNSVYVHSNEELKDFDPEIMSLAVTENTEKIGETEHWDEFVSPETGEASGRIAIGESWNNTLAKLHTKALDMDLREIASNSTSGQLFDVKANKDYAPYGGFTGKLLNGKYASARSAGNYLAGYNGSTGKYMGFGISWETYIKMAGAVHQGQWNKANAAKIMMFGTSFGEAPWYGEIEYAGRQIQNGWRHTGFKD